MSGPLGGGFFLTHTVDTTCELFLFGGAPIDPSGGWEE